MAEPTASNYPSSYDSSSTLFGPLSDRQVLTVKYDISVSALQVTVEEDLTGLVGPLFLQFEGGELWYVESNGISISSGDTIFSLANITQRGYHGSAIQPHSANESVYITWMASHHVMYKKAIQALQQNGFRLGTAAQRSAYEASAVAGEGWLETDTGKIYYCFSAGTFVWVNKTAHADLSGLADDDHTQYHTDARATTWHNAQSGVHITGGDDHNHYSTNQGSAIKRIRSGVFASRGTPGAAGDMYFATDTAEGGTLYISPDGTTWGQVSGVPAGAILAFAGACPSGWTRFTSLDSKYLYVDNANPGSTGGVSSHSHSYTDYLQHYHGVSGWTTGASTSPGNHSHNAPTELGGGGLSRLVDVGNTTGSKNTDNKGGHSHSVTMPAATTGSAGSASNTTSSVSTTGEPPYKEVVWCKKD